MTPAATIDVETVGIAAMRRIRTLGGMDSIRLVVTALLAFLLIDYVRLAATTPVAPLSAVMDILAYSAGVVAVWRPRIALGIAAIPLTAALFWPATSLDAFLLSVVVGLSLTQLSRRSAILTSLTLVLYIVVRVVAYSGDHRVAFATVLGIGLTLGLLAGWAGLVVRERRERAELSEARRSSENARIRSDERRTLSRELHDVVAHHLSTASLQIMGARGTTDPEDLARVLATVDEATTEALTELRLLVQVLRDDPTTAASGTELRELSEMAPPTDAAAAAELTLLQAGFEPHLSLPAEMDRVSMTVQRTLTRTIREATTNVVRHAPPKCRVDLQGVVREHEVILTVTNPVDPDADVPGLGWGLRGLRERASLTGGSFTAGVLHGNWVVSLTLPTT